MTLTDTVPSTIPPSPRERNYGYNPDYEERDIEESDWKLGGEWIECIAEIPVEERNKYLPIGEVQRGEFDDWMDCASRGPHNIEEAKLNYLYRNNLLLPENKAFLDTNGYVVWKDGIPYIELSDAFLAIKSGTDRQGNSMKRPIHCLHAYGAIPKSMLPADPKMTFEEYHEPGRITKEMERLAQEYRARFPMNYVRLDEDEFAEANERDFINLAGYAWPKPKNGIYPRTSRKANHVFVGIKPKTFAFDNYIDTVDGDFIKHLAEDFKFMGYAYRIILRKDQLPTNNIVEQLKFLLRVGDLTTFWRILRANFKAWLGFARS